jgi:hypothetical protein
MTGRPLAVLGIGTMLLVGCSAATSPAASPTNAPSVPVAVAATTSPTTSAMPVPSLVSGSPLPSNVSAIPDGDYETGQVTAAMITKALKGAGLGDQAPSAIASFGFDQYVTFTLRLRSGQYVEFAAVDGGPSEAGSSGTIVSITSDAIALHEVQAGSPVGGQQTFAFKWDGDSLDLDLVGGPNEKDVDDLAILTAIYESSGFTRKLEGEPSAVRYHRHGPQRFGLRPVTAADHTAGSGNAPIVDHHAIREPGDHRIQAHLRHNPVPRRDHARGRR